MGLPALDISGSFLGTTLCLLVLRVRVFGGGRLPRLGRSDGVIDPAPIFALRPSRNTDDSLQLTSVYADVQSVEEGVLTTTLESGFDTQIESATQRSNDSFSRSQSV